MTALHSACIFGHTEVVKHLINNNADILATNNVSDYTLAVFISYEVFCNCLLLTCYRI